MRVAVISDVHGNIWALEAVLKDIRVRGVDAIVNLGDSLYGPLAPRETAEALRASGIISLRGDRDRILFAKDGRGERGLTSSFVRGELDGPSLRWLGGLSPSVVFESEAYLCHGRLDLDDRYLFESVSPEGIRVRSPAELAHDVLGIRQNLILCGHSHVSRTAVLSDGTTIVNPGSVGLPALRDEWPFPHVLAAGSPHARYALVSTVGRRRDVQPVSVVYPWDLAAATALDNGRPDWAVWLRSGRAWRTGDSAAVGLS